jgi:daunorubicin/doxorubicin transport system permease protein
MSGRLWAFVDVNPLSHVTSAARDLMNRTSAGGAVGWTLTATAVLVLVCTPITLRLCSRQG